MALKNKDLAKLSAAEVNSKLSEIEKELMKLRGQRQTGAAQKNNRQMRVLRHTKAKLLARAGKGVSATQ